MLAFALCHPELVEGQLRSSSSKTALPYLVTIKAEWRPNHPPISTEPSPKNNPAIRGAELRSQATEWYNCYTGPCAFISTPGKSKRLRENPKRRIGFEEAREIFGHPYYLDQRSDFPEQYRAIGWVSGQLYSLIFEICEDDEGEFYHLVTLWKATKQEQKLYEDHS